MAAQIVVVGGGVGGLVTANRLALLAPDDVKITLVDATGIHTYQQGWLYVPFGEVQPKQLQKRLKSLVYDRVQLVTKPVTGIDLDDRTVYLDGERLAYDFLVLATGCEPNPTEVSGLAEGAHHFHSADGAMKLREALANFEGGTIVVGVGGLPYKCPPSPIEFVCLLHEHLVRKGIRNKVELVYATPLPRVFHIEPLVPIFEERFERFGIKFVPFFTLETFEPSLQKAISLDGTELTADLFVLVPPHCGVECVRKLGIGDAKGFIPTDRHTLQVQGQEQVYAIGDCTNLTTPKASTAAQRQALIAAENIVAQITGKDLRRYNGQVGCVIEVGEGEATVASFDYDNPPHPPKPSKALLRQKRGMLRLYWQIVPPALG
jgi:sulfide:quinone oxidoreductase